MPLTKNLKDKLAPDFLATLIAVGESIIEAKAPPSLAYALRDELPFEAWPDEAIEATARLVVALRRRLSVATRELLEQAAQVPALVEAQPQASSEGKNKGSKRDHGKHRPEGPKDKKPEKTGSPPTETGSTAPQRDNAA